MWPFSKSEDEEEEEEVWDPETQKWVKKKKKKKTTLRDENVKKVLRNERKSKADTIKAIFDEK